jgi:hypothetical protein
MEAFRVCPACGYGRGFHVWLNQEKGAFRIGLICPSCGRAYDLGWLSREVEGSEARETGTFPSQEAGQNP